MRNKKILIGSLVLIAVLSFLGIRRYSHSRIKNVLLISIDTCRADHLGCYGFERLTTPNIDTIAKEAIVFKNAISPVPLTLPAHSSILTGTIPPYHGIHDNIGYKLAEANITLAEIFKDNGYNTAAIVSSYVLDSQFGLSQGFDHYNDEFADQFKHASYNERKGEESSKLAIDWLENNRDKPFFFFLHYFDPHDKYDPPEPFKSRFRDDLYAGEIAYTDYCIGKVIKKLKELGLYNSTLIIITSDHGEDRGDHGEKTHGYFVYQSTIHVPLIVKVPGSAGGLSVDESVGLIDVFPTVCSLMGLEIPPSVQGSDLSKIVLELKVPPVSDRYLYSESVLPTLYDCNPLFSIVNRDWKYIHAPRPELYNIGRDPRENNNLSEKEINHSRFMLSKLQEIIEEHQGNETGKVEIDPESKRRLESLGYTGAVLSNENLTTDLTSSNDPKDYIHLHRDILKVIEYISAEHYQKAESIINKTFKEYPGYTLFDFYKGRIKFGQKKYHKAIDYLKTFLDKVSELEKHDLADKSLVYFPAKKLDSYKFIGESYYGLKDFKNAIKNYSAALKIDANENTLRYNMGIAYFKADDIDNAILTFAKACEVDPSFLDARRDLANCLQAKGDLQQAIEHYRRVLDKDPGFKDVRQGYSIVKKVYDRISQYQTQLENNPSKPNVHTAIGLLYFDVGSFEKAIWHWEKELGLYPDSADALNNLAWLKATCPVKRFVDPEGAVKLALKACEITNNKNIDMVETLAAAFAVSGRFDEAAYTIEKAIELSKSKDRPELLKDLNEKLSLYKARRE